VAKRGQWVLLAADDVACNDGDLVAATCASGDLLLRRIWSNGDSWTFEAINAVRPVNSVIAPKVDSAVRKIVGVLYEPSRRAKSITGDTIREWQHRADFQVAWLENLASVYVEGTSLDPIARAGQRVLIDRQPAHDHSHVRNGELAVVDTNVDGIGRVIKRVYHLGDECILISPNPVDPHSPEILTKAQLVEAKFWIVCGVLFETEG
jgi:SOS-response transcriptional repressor LexA